MEISCGVSLLVLIHIHKRTYCSPQVWKHRRVLGTQYYMCDSCACFSTCKHLHMTGASFTSIFPYLWYNLYIFHKHTLPLLLFTLIIQLHLFPMEYAKLWLNTGDNVLLTGKKLSLYNMVLYGQHEVLENQNSWNIK